MAIRYTIVKTSNGGWDVKRQNAKQISVHADTKHEAIKMGRVLSIKHDGVFVLDNCSQQCMQEKKVNTKR